MKKFKILWKIIKLASLDKVIYGFIIFVLLNAFILDFVEPSIKDYSDAIWYSFVSFTTIGFGDFVATTFIGRISTMCLAFYGILIIGIIPGVIVSYYQEIMNIKKNNNISNFLTDLEKLPELSKEELTELSNKVKKYRYKL